MSVRGLAVPCGTVSSCPLLDAFDSHDEKRSFTYAKLGGEVPFTYQDLKNSDVRIHNQI